MATLTSHEHHRVAWKLPEVLHMRSGGEPLTDRVRVVATHHLVRSCDGPADKSSKLCTVTPVSNMGSRDPQR
ncbi:hypothetical protein MES5069_350005 [Mesorhizobium escarrei]|uniref:Uncharacterized protein n=1 Tax=Mesorhizobium escarrei TaxID=666018 RepID=A0ABN8JXI6_9HYPH|nr:hypothetical protein MES5069_350005 [Mesorhizobium escarrei]